jgi:hypothetical protein
MKVRCAFDNCPLNNFFWLTNAYAEFAIIIVIAYGEGPVLASRAIM